MKLKFRKNPKKLNLTKGGLVLMLVIGLNLFGFLSIGSTTAFYNDTETSEGNFLGATSLDFYVDSQKEDGRFQTFTQGGWGSKAKGHNPGRYRDDNFDGAFPVGAVVGLPDSYNSATFTDAEAVKDFLPAGGTPGALATDYTDPIVTSAGVLAGQVLSLTLNVGFDLYDTNFSPSDNDLKDYVINNSFTACDGMTVQDVLDEGNNVLGGAASPFTPSQINDCATWINEKFDEGGGGGSISQFATILNGGLLDFQYTVHVEKTSGDDDFCNALGVEAFLEGASIYNSDLMTFTSSPTTYSSSADEWEFVISLPDNVQGSCGFDFVFSGWQTNLESFGGFSDIERVDDPVHSVAAVAVQLFDEELPQDDGAPTIQALGLEETLKVEESTTGEEIIVVEDDDPTGEDETVNESEEPVTEEEIVVDEDSVTPTEEELNEPQEEIILEEEVALPVEEENVIPTEEETLEPVEEEIKTEEEVIIEPTPEPEEPAEPPIDTTEPQDTISEETAL